MKTKIVENVQEILDNPDTEYQWQLTYKDFWTTCYWKKETLEVLLASIEGGLVRRILPEEKPETVEFVWMFHPSQPQLQAVPTGNVKDWEAIGWRVVNAVEVPHE